ncbi:hypothetical protein UYO_3242, partial [Lachnospiraceae bacterium JC7]
QDVRKIEAKGLDIYGSDVENIMNEAETSIAKVKE